MKVLFLLFIGLDRHETSEHLLTAVIEQVCLAGHSVHIIQKDTGGELPSIPQSLSKYQVTTETVPYTKQDKNKLAFRYFSEIKYLMECKKRIKEDYDAVFIQSTTVIGFAAYIIKKKLPKAIITLNIQDVFPYNALYSGKLKSGLLFQLFAVEQRYGYRKCDHIITISEDMKETLVADGVSENKIDVIYNWSYQDDLYDIRDNPSVSKMFDKNYFNVVYAGNIGVMQNVDVIIECANLMKDDKDIWFHIIGNGVYKDRLISKAEKYQINNISFWPMQPPELAPAVYCAADVNIIPLATNIYKTALPSKIATCLACQEPIILAIGKDSAFGKRLNRETGVSLVSSNDPQEVQRAINDIKNRQTSYDFSKFFKNNMSSSCNSRKYAETITRKD